ncbi:MAG: PDZ domain-containing protein, partial [Nitriliruptoraceae bacterium]
GSYLLRYYVHHVQSINATDSTGRDVEVAPDGLTAWRLGECASSDTVTINFEIYANDLSVRTSHVDDHHALIIPAATFIDIGGHSQLAHEVAFTGLRDHDQVHSLLPSLKDVFRADDYLHLVDSAFEVGDFPVVDFEILSVPHRFVWSAHGPTPDLDRIARDASAIGKAATALFDDELPIDRYTYLCTGWDQGGGGLEHRDGSVLQIPVQMLDDEASLPRFQSLMAHEYFHVWNVKRLTPAALVSPDLESAVHTESLWVAEGWTSYYDKLLPSRAQVWQPRHLIGQLSDMFQRVLDTPGVALQDLRTASHQAWTKHYVRDENSPNAGTDYYSHGGVVAWETDLRLRAARPDGDGLDDVLRLMWRRHSGHAEGYTEDDVLAAVAEVGGDSVAEHLERRITRPEPPAIDNSRLAVLGLRWEESTATDIPDLGVIVTEDDQSVVLASVLRDRPAWRAGVTGGDRLVAIDGWTVGRTALTRALRRYAAGDQVELTVTRGPRLLTLPVVLDPPLPQHKLVPVDSASTAQQDQFSRWCGWSFDQVTKIVPET